MAPLGAGRWRGFRPMSVPASASTSGPSRFFSDRQTAGDAGCQRIGHAYLALAIEQFEFFFAMLDDAGLEQYGRKR